MNRLNLLLFSLFLFSIISVYGVDYTGTLTCGVSSTPGWWSKFPYRMCNSTAFKPSYKQYLYIVGTGINTHHPELNGKGNVKNFIKCNNNPNDFLNDHDTTMAAMIVGNNLSPWASPEPMNWFNIIGYRVLPCSIEGDQSPLVQTLQEISTKPERPAAVSMALNIYTTNTTCYNGMFFSNNTMKSNYTDYCFGALTNMIKNLFNIGIPVFASAGNGFYPGYLSEFYDFSFHPHRAVGYDICRASQMGMDGFYFPLFSSPVFKRTSTNFARPIIIGSYKFETSKLASWHQYLDLQDNITTFDTGHTNYGDCIEFYAPTSIPMIATGPLTTMTGDFQWESTTDPSNVYYVPGKPLTVANYMCDVGYYATSWATAVAHLFFYKFGFDIPYSTSLKNATILDTFLNRTFYNTTYSYLETTTGMTVLDGFHRYNETTYASYTHRNLRNPFCI